VMTAKLDGDRVTYEPFAQGWLTKAGDTIGRPVDVLVLPDGSMLVSDDHHHAIYRVTYQK
jgi:glucose/arabinose dehydrogenase